jgi:hypothetical protein
MEVSTIQKRTIKSISEWSVFKMALIIYLVIFILTVIFFGIITFISWTGFANSGVNLNNLLSNSNFGLFLERFKFNTSNLNLTFGTVNIVEIALFIIFDYCFQ